MPTPGSRPFHQASIEVLENAAERAWNNRAQLMLVLGELQHRSTRRADDLRSRIADRLAEFTSTTTESPAVAGPGASEASRETGKSSTEHQEQPNVKPKDEAARQGSTTARDGLTRAIEEVRTKLLDLSGNNRLLNFRHAKRAIRVVHEYPSHLFDRLIDGDVLTLRPIPEPRGELEDIGIPMLPKLNAPEDEVLSKDEPDGAEQIASPFDGVSPKRERESGWTRNRKKKKLLPDPAIAATRVGIDPDYDMPLGPLPASGASPEHRDKFIQTLWYPDDLEAILGKYASEANLLLQETGSNMLQLALGFLEWRESGADLDTRLSPLILVPVELKKGLLDISTHAYRYSLNWSGEDVMVNVSLQEKLRRDFGIALRDFRPETDSWSTYIQEVESAVTARPGWEVHGYVTLAILQFGKILLWKDLNDVNWPNGEGPEHHTIVRELFEGQRGEGSLAATEYDIDAPDLQANLPPLIYDANSSQHSALVDAMGDKNLVIEGPPGTGKSQTITNLIASAIVSGKKILFVAEKAAALNVVHNKLKDAVVELSDGTHIGLNAFCLELHSTRSKKRDVLDHLKRRLGCRDKLLPPVALESKLRTLNAARETLIDYARLMQAKVGTAGHSLHTVLWAARRRRTELGKLADDLDFVVIPGLSELEEHELEMRERTLEAFCSHFTAARVAGNGNVRQHPWAGLNASRLTVVERPQAQRLARLMVDRSTALADACAAFTGVVAPEGLETRGAFQLVGEALDRLVVQMPIEVQLLPKLDQQNVRERLVDFVSQVTRARREREDLQQVWGTLVGWPTDTLERADTELRALARVVPDCDSVEGARSWAHRVDVLANQVQQAAVTVAEHRDLRPSWETPTIASTEELLGVLGSLKDVPPSALGMRNDVLRNEDSVRTLEQAAAFQAEVRALENRLRTRLRLDVVPQQSEVIAHVGAIAGGGTFAFLRGDYRAARRCHRKLCRTAKATRSDALEDLEHLVSYLVRRGAFERSDPVRRICGPHAAGIESPIAELLTVARWYHRLQTIDTNLGPGAQRVADLWWAMPAAALRTLWEQARNLTDDHPLVTLSKALKEIAQLRGEGKPQDADTELYSLNIRLLEAVTSVRTSTTELDRLGIPSTVAVDAIRDAIRRIRVLRELEAGLGEADSIPEILGAAFHGHETNLRSIENAILLRDHLDELGLPEAIRAYLTHQDFQARHLKLHELSDAIIAASRALNEAETHFADLSETSLSSWYGEPAGAMSVSVNWLVVRNRLAADAPALLVAWLDYWATRMTCAELGLGPLVEGAEKDRIPAELLTPSLQFLFWQALARESFRQNPTLNRFSGINHEQLRERFRTLDGEMLTLTRALVASKVDGLHAIPWGNGMGPVATRTELALIHHEMQKERRHIPLRQLMKRAGSAIQGLMPCFMMSPLSVAQYLPPGLITFDLVVMDEASQMRPEDALGVVARSGQVVIVGDRQQLPPTTFFDSVSGETEDLPPEEDLGQGVREAESILDIASQVYTNGRMLKWHYRSEHESLIAFSNQEFYKNQLVVFPSPRPAASRMGVIFEYVQHGMYSQSVNLIEAERVAESVIQHMEEYPAESLGVAAMNVRQRDVLEAEIERRTKDHPAAQAYLAKWQRTNTEQFFVKNLENVQGDERDVIFVSITYGPDETGRVLQRFGPINGVAGHRRLNVLFTRAKRRLVVFSSMTSDQIRVDESSQRGTIVLKRYLHFAQYKQLDQISFTGREPDSDFEREVAMHLQQNGYACVAQLGVAGFFIDIAVRDPRRPGSWLLGIECDGATYHSGKSVRERDRLRQMKLEDLGWTIHRIWSTEWFKNPEREVARLREALTGALAAQSTGDFPPSEL